MRKMATIQRVSGVFPIAGKDRIEHYQINGWRVIATKDEYKVGEKVVFCEIDSFIPVGIVPCLDEKRRTSYYGMTEGHILKTMKMGGVLSQGLLLPVPSELDNAEVGDDVSEVFGILKWEPPTPRDLRAKGNFPHFVPKTDQPRVQNLHTADLSGTWLLTEKLEGMSATYALHENEFFVCSRNIHLKNDTSNEWTNIAEKYNLEDNLRRYHAEYGVELAIQGEIVGNGVQGNIYGLQYTRFHIYSIYDITQGRYLSRIEFNDAMEFLMGEEWNECRSAVPIVGIIKDASFMKVDDFLAIADGVSVFGEGVRREGVVFVRVGEGDSASSTPHAVQTFKAISNEYLVDGPKIKGWVKSPEGSKTNEFVEDAVISDLLEFKDVLALTRENVEALNDSVSVCHQFELF